MKGTKKKSLALLLCAVTAATTVLSGCGASGSSSSGSDDADSFTMMIDKSVNTIYYDDYDDNPVGQYWQDMEWDVDGETKKISIDFTSPTAGSESDQMNTLLATGEYPDIMCLSYSSESATALYEEGIALDITEYVEKYMPNYLAQVEAKNAYNQVTNEVDGERRFLQLYGICDVSGNMWAGYMYRRDWILEYGTNPQTGEKFTGGWNEDKTEWTDDIVFPSGNTDPIYISDWEWMLEIFAEAEKELGMDDGIVSTLYYPGYVGTGDFCSGFGASCAWYLNENGVAEYGGTSENFRAYIECMNTWYENGWIDETFDERTTDMFFHIDDADTYSGKVGACYASLNILGSALANPDDPYLENCMFMGAPQPINDVYGDDSCKYNEPACYYNDSLIGSAFVITDKASEKDLAALFTALDYLYSEEGGLLKSRGFSKEQQEELQNEFYNENGLEDGGYWWETLEDGTEKVRINTEVYNVTTDLEEAAIFQRMPGLQYNNTDRGDNNVIEHSYSMWKKYPVTGMITSTITNQLTSDQATENSEISTNISTYYSVIIPQFVTGEKDITDDSEWQEFVDETNAYNVDKYTENINSVLQ